MMNREEKEKKEFAEFIRRSNSRARFERFKFIVLLVAIGLVLLFIFLLK